MDGKPEKERFTAQRALPKRIFLSSSNSREMSCLLTNWICAIQTP